MGFDVVEKFCCDCLLSKISIKEESVCYIPTKIQIHQQMVLEMSILIMKYILTRLYLGSADRWYKYALAKKEEYEVVKDLDKCLEEKRKKIMSS